MNAVSRAGTTTNSNGPMSQGDMRSLLRSGAVVVPLHTIDAMKAAAEGLAAREAKIIAAARAPDMTVEKLKAAFKG